MDYVKYIMAELHACGHLRGEVIAREVNRKYNDIRLDIKMDMFQSDTIGTSLIVFLRMHQQAFLDRMEVCKRLGVKTAYDIDDDMFNIPPECVEMHELFKDPLFVANHKKFLNTADAVIVSTRTLAEAVKKHTSRPIFVVNNSLDVENWDSAFAKRISDDPTDTVTIGWTGSSFHIYDATVIEDALVHILEDHKNVRIHFIGQIVMECFKTHRLEAFADRMVFDRWVPIDKLPEAMSDMDIGLAPLNSHVYNMSRSGIKWMQYSALGIPVVASPFPPYQEVIKDNETGMLVDMNSPSSWHDRIEKLVVDANLRTRMGLKARREVLEKHDIRNNVSMWRECYKQIIAM